MVLPVYALIRAVILDFSGSIRESLQVFARKRPPACSDSGFEGGEFGNRCMVPPAEFVVSTLSASDSNFRSVKGEWFRLLRSLRQHFPRPIPIFVAASKISPPATVVATALSASNSNFRCRIEG